MGFRVATEEVRAAGRSMRRAATQLARITPHDDLEPMSTAMPGSLSAASATTLTGVWRRRFSQITEATELHGDALVTDADDYDASDCAVDDALSGIVPGRRPGEQP
jgi:hypothetical protein